MISIILVVLFLSSFLIMIDITQLQMLMQHGSDMTALEFSRYAHIFSAFEVDHLLFNQPDNKIDEIYNDLEDIISVAKDTVDSDSEISWLEVREGIFKLEENFKQTLVWFENPDSLKKDLSEFILENSIEYLINTSGEYVVQKLFDKYFNDINLSNPFIKVSGINLSESELFTDQGNIDLIIEYKVEIQIPFLIDTEIESSVSSTTRAFISNSVENNSSKSVWETKDYWWRGKFIISQEMKNVKYTVPEIAGIHGADYIDSSLKLYRVMSFDPFRKTNDLDQFSKIVLKHIGVYSEKTSNLANIVIESETGEKRSIDLKECSLVKNIIVIIPANTEQEKLFKMNKVIKKYEKDYNLIIHLKQAYGDSNYDD